MRKKVGIIVGVVVAVVLVYLCFPVGYKNLTAEETAQKYIIATTHGRVFGAGSVIEDRDIFGIYAILGDVNPGIYKCEVIDCEEFKYEKEAGSGTSLDNYPDTYEKRTVDCHFTLRNVFGGNEKEEFLTFFMVKSTDADTWTIIDMG